MRATISVINKKIVRAKIVPPDLHCYEEISDLEKYGAELFYWNSDVSKEKQVEIAAWFGSLSEKEKEYVMLLRHEAKQEVEYDQNDY